MWLDERYELSRRGTGSLSTAPQEKDVPDEEERAEKLGYVAAIVNPGAMMLKIVS
jgi:hypothetical protein